MAGLTLRNLEPIMKGRLRVRAAEHGRSVDEEARLILRRTVGEAADLGAPARRRAADPEGKEVAAPSERGPVPEAVARRAAALLAIGRSWRGGADLGGAGSEEHAGLYGEDGLPR